MACTILIYGHSFIRNLGYVVENGQNPNWVNLGLAHEKFRIHFYGVGGGTLAPGANCMLNAKHMSASLGKYSPSIVFMQLGGNDLSRSDCVPETLAKHIVSAAAVMIESYGVSQVVIGQLLSRFYSPTSKYFRPHYNSLVVRVNTEIDRLVSNMGRQDIRFWRHRGFWKDPYSLIEDDGVHLNADGMYKYAQSVRVGVAGTAREAGLTW